MPLPTILGMLFANAPLHNNMARPLLSRGGGTSALQRAMHTQIYPLQRMQRQQLLLRRTTQSAGGYHEPPQSPLRTAAEHSRIQRLGKRLAYDWKCYGKVAGDVAAFYIGCQIAEYLLEKYPSKEQTEPQDHQEGTWWKEWITRPVGPIKEYRDREDTWAKKPWSLQERTMEWWNEWVIRPVGPIKKYRDREGTWVKKPWSLKEQTREWWNWS